MPAYSAWGVALLPEETQKGRAITDAIRRDMTQFDDYLTHELIEDGDDPGHLLVVSQWTTGHRADEVLREYANHPNAQHANELVSRPRTRFAGHALPGAK
jgi:hypothetical protein